MLLDLSYRATVFGVPATTILLWRVPHFQMFDEQRLPHFTLVSETVPTSLHRSQRWFCAAIFRAKIQISGSSAVTSVTLFTATTTRPPKVLHLGPTPAISLK